MRRSIGTVLVIGLAVCGVGLGVPGGSLAAWKWIVTGEEADSGTLLVPVMQIAGGKDYEGEMEISPDGIAYISGYTGAWKFTPWRRILRWRCFGSKDVAPNEEALCILMMRIETEAPPATPHPREYLFFKIPCEMVAGQENWETMQQYDPWGHF